MDTRIIAPWAAAEAAGATLGDRRRVRLLAALWTALLAGGGRSFSVAVGDALRQAASTLLALGRLTVDDFLAGHYRRTAERCAAEPVVLVSHDTTGYAYTLRRSLKGLGNLGNKVARGIWGHSALALTTAGRPLGLLGLLLWVRREEGTAAQRRSREWREKESHRWQAMTAAVTARLAGCCRVVMVADREADVYEYLSHERPAEMELLVRACWDRGVEGDDRRLFCATRRLPPIGAMTIQVSRQQRRPARTARLTVRGGEVTVKSPRHWPSARRSKLRLTVIVAAEEPPPAGETPLCWRLYSTATGLSAEALLERLTWYQRRWQIELQHAALKSEGYRVERLQFRSVAVLQKALALYHVVVWRTMDLAWQYRLNPDGPPAELFEPDELAVLELLAGETLTTVKAAVRQVAKLGGYAGYPSTPPPGKKVIKDGLQTLSQMVLLYRLVQDSDEGLRNDTR